MGLEADTFFAEFSAEGTLAVAGEIDVVSAPAFESALRSSASGTQGPLVVDLSGVTFIDSAGINALVRIFKVLDAGERELVVRAPIDRVRRVLDLGGVRAFADVE